MSNLTFTANYPPYNDFFNTHENNLKVLFKPGYNITPTDLNRIQSIIQEQIAIFGTHFLRNGSFVSGGAYKYIPYSNLISCISTDVDLLNVPLTNLCFKHEDSDCIIKIINPKLSDTDILSATPNYYNQIVSLVSGTFPIFSKDENFILWNIELNIPDTKNLVLKIRNVTSIGYIIINSGVLFLDGYFVYFKDQVKLINVGSNNKINSSIGFKIFKNIVSNKEDFSLLDNARGFYSFGAPGADRLKITVFLETIPTIEDSNYFDISVKENFIEYLRIRDGLIVKDVTLPIYNEFEKVLARRTFDESGNYTTKPFKAFVSSGEDGDFKINISPGKAYIFGYETEILRSQTLTLPKIKSTITKSNEILSAGPAGYIIVKDLNYLIDVSMSESIIFKDIADNYIGECNCFLIEKKEDHFFLYIFNLKFINNNTINDASYICNTFGERVGDYLGNSFESLGILPKTSFKYNLLGSTHFSQVVIWGQKIFTENNGLNPNTNIITFNPDGSEEFSFNQSDILAFDSGRNLLTIIDIEYTDQFSVTINTENNIPIYFAILSNIKFYTNEITRIPVTVTTTVTLDSNNSIFIEDELDSFSEILYNNENILPDFTISFRNSPFFVGGFTLTYAGSLLLANKSVKLVYSKYNYSSGQYLISGNELDFRKVSNITSFSIHPETEISCSVIINPGRIDKLVLTKNRNFELITGKEAVNVIPPKDREDAMTLYSFYIPPNVLSYRGIGIKRHETKRYTMQDIGKLEKRIENLEYYTALNLLEKETSDQSFPDEEGNNRFKNGFLVDNFKTFKSVSMKDMDCLFSLDIDNGYLRPEFEMIPHEAQYNVRTSTTQLTGSLITLPYIEVPLIEQLLASDIRNLNPYEIFVWEGKIELDPSSDFWIDTSTKPDIILNNYGENDVYAELGSKGFTSKWNSWESDILKVEKTSTIGSKEVNPLPRAKSTIKILWNPTVTTQVDPSILSNYNLWVESNFREGFSNKLKPDGYVNTKPAIWLDSTAIPNYKLPEDGSKDSKLVVKSQIMTNSLGETVRDVSFVPYLRSKTIRFDANCLKPNTKFYVTFDNKNVTSYCYMAGSKVLGYLKTNDYGELSGYFTIPEKTFNLGTKIFKLLDSLETLPSSVTSFAVTTYHGKGLSQTKQEAILSTREPIQVSKIINTTKK